MTTIRWHADWVEEIRGVATDAYRVLDAPDPKTVRSGAQELLLRRSDLRQGRKRIRKRCIFDDIDILVIDYDLLHIDEANAQYTGEGLGRLVRMFTECAVIVVVNQYPQAHFDLRLRGHLESHADLNMDAELIAVPGLWREPPWTGFRPWRWQTLNAAVRTQRARQKVVATKFSQSVLDTVGMRSEDASRLSDFAFGFLSPSANRFQSLREATFQSFLNDASDGRDIRSLAESDREAATRVASARIGKWLEREILGGQDVLIDIPHLLQRFPFVLGDTVADLDIWNSAVHDPEVVARVVEEDAWFARNEILSRPAIWTSRFQADTNVREMRATFDFASVPEFVFVEDRSVFVKLSEAMEFRAGFHNVFDRRYIARVDGISYGPQRRLAFGS